MSKFITKILLAIVGTCLLMVTIAISALLTGTVLWLIWPVAMVTVFGLPVLTWWQAVTLTWVASILIKSSLIQK